MASLTFDGVTRHYQNNPKPSVADLDLEIADGEFLVLVGPSGCGKSTTLRMLAGLEPIDGGRLLMDGEDITHVRAADRDVAMVFQSYALYPNMTARQNMAFALENRKVPKPEIDRLVAEAADILQLGHLIDRKPAAMSGGERQRVAMGRAIVRQPAVFCMDEPLSNLDAKLRVSTRAQIAELQRRLGTTTVFVTHDQTEAMTMGDRVCVLSAGELQQVDTPENLYDHPANTFVAGFIGSPAITLIDDVPVGGGEAVLGADQVRVPLPEGGRRAGASVTLGFRPEAWRLVDLATDPDALRLQVQMVENLGSDKYAYGESAREGGELAIRGGRITVRLPKHAQVGKGDVIGVRPVLEEAHAFDGGTGRSLLLP